MKKSIRLFIVFFLIIFAFGVIVTSCNKDESNLTKEEMLTAKSWKISSSKTNGVADDIEDCEKDNFLTFATNGTYVFNPGTNKCFTEDNIQSGIWDLSTDEKYLLVDGDSVTLVNLTPKQFTISNMDGDFQFEATYVSF